MWTTFNDILALGGTVQFVFLFSDYFLLCSVSYRFIIAELRWAIYDDYYPSIQRLFKRSVLLMISIKFVYALQWDISVTWSINFFYSFVGIFIPCWLIGHGLSWLLFLIFIMCSFELQHFLAIYVAVLNPTNLCME